MDRIGHPRRSFNSAGTSGVSLPDSRHSNAAPTDAEVCEREFLIPLFPTPAERITFITPATKPSSMKTISPHGDVDSKRSKPQPIVAPTTTPATSSEERRRPTAMADALDCACPLAFRIGQSGFALILKFGQTLIQTSEPCGKRSLVGRRFAIVSAFTVIVPCAVRHACDTRNNAANAGNNAPSPFKAGRTILSASCQVKIALIAC